MHADWLIPDWPVAPRVRSICTTRAGGESKSPWDSLNLGDHVGDSPSTVQANRALVVAELGVNVTFMQQVHGTQLLELPRVAAPGKAAAPIADGAYTRAPGNACCAMVADCLPILLTNRYGTLVAAVHAGWRGLAGVNGHGVVESVAGLFIRAESDERRNEDDFVMAWLGPCIGPAAFEVGSDVREAFAAHDDAAADCFEPKESGKWMANLSGLARLRLNAQGINRIYGNDGSADWCTYSNPSRFFSHRRDGVSGRQAAFIWLE